MNVNSFGKLWAYPVSGSVFAQPLYMMNVDIPGKGTHNVVYIVTMNDVVYAYDADSSSGTSLWLNNLTSQVSGSTPVPISDIVQSDSLNIVGNVGIESTPVIDPSTNTMYLVARTKESGNYFQRLHALDITTGAEKFGGPAVISGSVSGTGTDSSGGVLAFNALIEDQRSSLALSDGQIFMAWGSHEDLNPYHGWVMSYSASTLQRTGIFCNTPNGSQGGIWMAGRAPAVDSSGNVYYMTGNGTWNGTSDFSESFLKFSTGNLTLLDWFTPDNYAQLSANDEDLGSSGPLQVPGASMVIGGGKQSLMYLMNDSSLGHENGSNRQIVESLNVNGGQIHGGPVYWNRSGGVGPWMYVWADSADTLKAWHFNGSTFDSNPVSRSGIDAPSGESGGVLTLSANGSTPGSGVIWSSMPTTDNADHGIHAGVLRAFNADNLTTELWDSNQNASRDSIGNWPKYSAPLVVNGRVYEGGYPSDGVSNTTVSVFGLLGTGPSGSFSLSSSSSGLSINQGGSSTSTMSVTDLNGFTGNVTLAASGLPGGVTASFGTNPTTGSTMLTLSANSLATTGDATVTITGTSGSLKASTTIVLTVNGVTSKSSTFTCHVSYSIASQWPSGFGTALTIENTGTAAISDWTLTWTFANGQTITQSWNGNVSQSGSKVTVTNVSYNGLIPAGGTYAGFGFNGTWNNSTNSAPSSFAVNGTTCK